MYNFRDAGLSNFGILQMQWTTGVPTVKDKIHPPQRIPQHRSHKMIRPDSGDLDPHGLPNRYSLFIELTAVTLTLMVFLTGAVYL